MSKRLYKYLPYLILLAGIIFLWYNRWDSLSQAYFWDEMGVYGKGVQYLFANGIGVLPASLPPDISRGHPLLFYTIHAAVLQCFGNEFFVSHLFALLISSATILSVYFLAAHFFPKPIAAATACLLLCQNIFVAQSTLVIPEMSIALISTLALLSYFKGRYLYVVLLLCVGVWIKESVILIAAFFSLIYLIKIISTGSLLKNAKQLLLFTLPLFAFLAFLLIQKIQNGWYFFPYHTEIVQEGAFSGFWDKLEMHYNFIFYKQGRNQWLIAAIIALLSLSLIKETRKMLVLFGFFVLNLVVFSLAFYMDRYLLYLYPVIVIIIAQGVYVISGKQTWLSLILLFVLSGLSLQQLNNPSFRYDVSLAYEDIMDVHLDAADALCAIDASDFSVGSNFPINMSIDDVSLGYLNAECRNRLQLYPLNQDPDYMMLYNAAAFGGYDVVEQFTKGEATIVLYQRSE